MDKVWEIIAYQDHFENFLIQQTEKVQNKIYKVLEALEAIETIERVPEVYLKSIKSTKGLFEARIQLGSNSWRIFCFMIVRNLARKLLKIGIGDQNGVNPPPPDSYRGYRDPKGARASHDGPDSSGGGRDFGTKILKKTSYLQHSG